MSKKDSKKGEPMDATIREEKVGTPSTNSQRACWSAKTFVAEVNELFPETSFEYSNYDGRNTALDVTFDLTSMLEDEAADLVALLTLFDLDADPRIQSIDTDDSEVAMDATKPGQVLVSFKPGPRTQDSREPFGLADALLVLSDSEDDDYSMFNGVEFP